METAHEDLSHKRAEIQDSRANGFNGGITTLSNHQSNGLKNVRSCHSDIRDMRHAVVSSVRDSDVTLSCTPLQITDLLACSTVSPGMIKKYAFLFDDKIPGDSLGDPRTDKQSGVATDAASNRSPGSATSGGQGLSPASLSNGNQSVCFSMDESVFTYDETQNDLDSGGTTERSTIKDASDASDGQKTSSEVEHPSPVSCDDDTKYVDKSMLIKSVIEKVYVHTITYTVEDLLRFEKFKAEIERSRNNQATPNSEKTSTPSPTVQKELVHKKFSGGSIKNFLKSMTPKSRHRTLSKGSGSFGSRSSSNLGDSTDGASVSDEPLESADSAQKAHLTRHPDRKSPAFGGISGSPKNRTQVPNKLTADYLKGKTVDSPASYH